MLATNDSRVWEFWKHEYEYERGGMADISCDGRGANVYFRVRPARLNFELLTIKSLSCQS